MIEKLCCALAWAAKRLRQYMLYHTTWLISKLDPLRYICGKPYLSGPLEASMVVNFRARGISRGVRKLARTPTLI
jgi:hypothetical protein